MGFFRRAKIAPEAALPRRNPLLAVPMIPKEIEWGADESGRIQLRRQRQVRGPVSSRLARFIPVKYPAARLNLDEYGSFYWKNVNARRTLDDIAHAFASHFDIPLEKARTAVLTFTRTLMLRNMVLLEVEKNVAT